MTGVVAFQGSFALHLRALARVGEAARPVKHRRDLDGLDRLVLPGGESTVISQFLESEGLGPPLAERARAGDLAVLGTCAGAILLGREPADAEAAPAPAPGARVPREPLRLGVCETEVRRNAYGRQIDSFRAALELAGGLAAAGPGEAPFEGVFIRAPRFGRVAPGAEVLARHGDEAVMVREGRIALCAFHPELTDDPRIHRWFLAL